ncbi:hypothetical protein [Paenisporosarcina quisquiliarum]|jgi:hypothetical protein
MTFIFTLIVTLLIGAFMNIIFKTTKVTDWLGVIAVSIFSSMIITVLL